MFMRIEQPVHWIRKDIIVYLVLLSLGLLEYAMVLNKGFASDDFGVLYRVIHQKNFLQQGFFRPLSDISLYACYLIGGLHPLTYNLFNVLLHVSGAFLLFKITGRYFQDQTGAGSIGIAAALLFLCYPFHNESIVWVVGRASILSCFLGFYSLYIALGPKPGGGRMALAAFLYFAAMSTYETVAPLPGIALILLYRKEHPAGYYLKWILAYSIALGLNLVLRFATSDDVVGDYGSRIFDPSIPGNLLKFAKTFGRIWLPPQQSPAVLVVLTLIVGVSLVIVSRIVMTRKPVQRFDYLKLLLAFLLSCLLPFLFGVSTRTIEGDRVLYFPSFFQALWLAFTGYHVIRSGYRLYFLLAVLACWTIFLELNNYTWIQAAGITQKIMHAVIKINQDNPSPKQKLILNIPEEYRGAHVFRNGLYDAVLLNGGDTTGIGPLGFQGPSESALPHTMVQPQRKDSVTWIGTYAGLQDKGLLLLPVRNTADTLIYHLDDQYLVYYWNNQELVRWR